MARKTKYIIKWDTIEYGEALTGSPERRLLQAIIVRAIKDLKDIRSSIDAHRDAKRWFESPSMKPFTYRWCCQKLNWDYEEGFYEGFYNQVKEDSKLLFKIRKLE